MPGEQAFPRRRNWPSGRQDWLVLARLFAILVFVGATNYGFAQRVVLVIDQGRLTTLAGFIGVWALCLTCLIIAAMQPNVWIRASWAFVLAVATAVGMSFRLASGGELGILDVLSLWMARHEIGRAAEFYTAHLYSLTILLIIGFALFAAPPVPRALATRRWLTRFAWLPLLPIAFIAAIVFYKDGGGAQALPVQFAPLSVTAVAGAAVASAPIPARTAVAWRPGKPLVRRIVVLVDESVRGDYIDWSRDNPHTPELARLKPRLVDHGPAASGGVCSHYSNALLRFMAARDHLGRQLLANPTMWQYARNAGFRTVFIDAQAAFNRVPGKLQNFMTPDEVKHIDRFYPVPEDVPPDALDDRLLDVIVQELRSSEPVLIYANKNGAHFPYDRGYPTAEAPFRPAMADAVTDTAATRVNSYRNVVRWTVDRFFKRLFDEADLRDTLVVYTSDHGQLFDPARLSHCSVQDPDPREALVPLFTISTNEDLRTRLAVAAESNRGRASHFQIAPTVLELLGYDLKDIVPVYGAALFDKIEEPAAFTSGDVFNLFSRRVLWHPIDLTASYLEAAASASGGQAPDKRMPDGRAALAR